MSRAALALAIAFAAAPAFAASPDEAAVGRTLDAFHAAAAHSDFMAYFDLFTPDGVFIGMTGFGASAPYKELYKKFGITAEAVADAAMKKLQN